MQAPAPPGIQSKRYRPPVRLRKEETRPYLWTSFETGFEWEFTYRFAMGTKKAFVRWEPEKGVIDTSWMLKKLANRVSFRAVNGVWRKDLEDFLSTSDLDGTGNGSPLFIGWITYDVVKCCVAETTSYYPREYLGLKVARRFPYFMEAVSTQHLKSMGITHVSTDTESSHYRIAQLARVDLKAEKETKIDDWLKGMGRGIRKTLGSAT